MSPTCVTCNKPGRYPNAGYHPACGQWVHVRCECPCVKAKRELVTPTAAEEE